jgi:hypothetical protein
MKHLVCGVQAHPASCSRSTAAACVEAAHPMAILLCNVPHVFTQYVVGKAVAPTSGSGACSTVAAATACQPGRACMHAMTAAAAAPAPNKGMYTSLLFVFPENPHNLPVQPLQITKEWCVNVRHQGRHTLGHVALPQRRRSPAADTRF